MWINNFYYSFVLGGNPKSQLFKHLSKRLVSLRLKITNKPQITIQPSQLRRYGGETDQNSKQIIKTEGVSLNPTARPRLFWGAP